MRVFVTGATGFIGRHTVDRMLQSGHQVHCLVRRPQAAADLCRPGVELIAGDVTDRVSVRQAMKDSDCVIHLAGAVAFWVPDPTVYQTVNVEGTRNVMEAALDLGVPKVIHVSSATVWSNPAPYPFTEETPMGTKPTTGYARTKYEGDQLAWALFRQRKLPLIGVYPAVVLGPGDEKVVGPFIRDFLSGRTRAGIFLKQVMTYVDVRDVAEIIARIAERDGQVGQKYLAAAHRVSYGEFFGMISDLAGVSAPGSELPVWLVRLMAGLLTRWANLSGRPPLFGLSLDAVQSMETGLQADGSKAAATLGVDYRPLDRTLAEEIAWIRHTEMSPDKRYREQAVTPRERR